MERLNTVEKGLHKFFTWHRLVISPGIIMKMSKYPRFTSPCCKKSTFDNLRNSLSTWLYRI
ncbi:MAG: hypothetical protein ACHQUC_09820, partial [Chlamydiales bacterium]